MDKISKKGVLECLIRGVARVTFIVFCSLLISLTDDLIDVVPNRWNQTAGSKSIH